MTEQELQEIIALLGVQGWNPQVCDTPVPVYDSAVPCGNPSDVESAYTFTREDAQRMRQQMGVERGSLKQMLANWRHRGYIAPVVRGEEAPESACQLFAKTEDYLRRK